MNPKLHSQVHYHIEYLTLVVKGIKRIETLLCILYFINYFW